MINPFITKKGINRIYLSSIENSYSCKFYNDFSIRSFFILNEKDNREDFFSFEPSGCILANLIYSKICYGLKYSIEEAIDETMYSLMKYGRAYIYLEPHYVRQEPNQDRKVPAKQIVYALSIKEIKGGVKRIIGDKCIFYRKDFNGNIVKNELSSDGVICLNIKELGYRKNYFSKLLEKLDKCDVHPFEKMIDGNSKNIYSKKKRMKFLKKTEFKGRSFRNEDFSDSYILYRKILQDKFRIKVLEFIVDKINEGLLRCLHDESAGKLVVNIRKLDYDEIWARYLRGEITITELKKLLYKGY